MKRYLLLLTALVMLPSAGTARTSAPTNVGDDLPPRIRSLLIEEMNAIEKATHALLEALVRGQHEAVAAKAQAIHDSFILQQQLTEADRSTLKRVLPKAFLQQDQAFHDLSARLADAARAGDTQRQQALFADLVEACVQCHSRYARGRFPGFDAPQGPGASASPRGRLKP